MYKSILYLLIIYLSCNTLLAQVKAGIYRPVIPALTHKDWNPSIRIRIEQTGTEYRLDSIRLSFDGTDNIKDIESVALFQAGRNTMMLPKPISQAATIWKGQVSFHIGKPVTAKRLDIWVAVSLHDDTDIDGMLQVNVEKIHTSTGDIPVTDTMSVKSRRIGVAVRNPLQDGIFCSRIPGLTTAADGSLAAIYDARHESTRDLQGDIDIMIQTSKDGGSTWSTARPVLDMGTYGGLPERYNGVGDGNILSDDRTGDLFVSGTWMYGVLDPQTGEWIKGIDGNSTVWNHHTSLNGSLSGISNKRTCQFLMSRSRDNGQTWEPPVNITQMIKRKTDRYFCPCPGKGITMKDGTLVIPVQARDSLLRYYASIIYSKDGGDTWILGNPAGYGGGESAVVELDDGSLMLNQHRRDNYKKKEGNGRYIMISSDIGMTWKEHHTSRKALIEPPCEASLHKHWYHDADGNLRSILLFVNPNSYTSRNNITLQASFDDGETWTEKILLDEWNGSGYSCMTSIGEDYIGILYEGSQADLQFQRIHVKEIIENNNNRTL